MSKIPMRERPLFFCDVETGGLDPTTSDVVEIAWIVTDPTGRDVREEFSTLVKPEKPVHPAAAAMNGYTVGDWALAPFAREVTPKIVAAAKDAVFASHVTSFDWGFVSEMLRAGNVEWPGDYHRLCTAALAWPLLHRGEVEGVKLENLALHFGIVNETPHRALGDVRTCRAVYLRLMEMYEDQREAASRFEGLFD